MKQLLFILIAFGSTNIYAGELCDSSKFSIEPDHQIPESHFTKENSIKSLAALSTYVSGTETPSNWTVIPNHTKTIEGYMLKKRALDKKDIMHELALADFCLFMRKSAFIND